MVLDLIVTDTGDGYSAEVPSINGCECWAHTEDEVIEKSRELVYFYLNLPSENEIIIDKARRKSNRTVYKIIFNKNVH